MLGQTPSLDWLLGFRRDRSHMGFNREAFVTELIGVDEASEAESGGDGAQPPEGDSDVERDN